MKLIAASKSQKSKTGLGKEAQEIIVVAELPVPEEEKEDEGRMEFNDDSQEGDDNITYQPQRA